MTRRSLYHRLEKLEAAGTSGFELGWADLVEWVHDPENPAYADYSRRPLKPALARLMAEEIARIEALRAEKAEEWAASDRRDHPTDAGRCCASQNH